MSHNDFKNIQLKKDGSYICDYKGVPYHVPNGYGYEDKWVEITTYLLTHPEEVIDYIDPIAPELTYEQRGSYIRSLRNIKFNKIEARTNRYRSQKEANLLTTDTDEWYQEALLYLEELRRIPEQEGFPYNIVWPEHPDHKVYGIEEEDPYKPY